MYANTATGTPIETTGISAGFGEIQKRTSAVIERTAMIPPILAKTGRRITVRALRPSVSLSMTFPLRVATEDNRMSRAAHGQHAEADALTGVIGLHCGDPEGGAVRAADKSNDWV